jgi:phosphoribosylglycinamide formyltransferase-1
MSEAAGLRTVVLISGRGSNLEALIQASEKGRLAIHITAVISNRPDAAGLQTASNHNIACEVIDHTDYPDRESFDTALLTVIETYEPKLVVLAGFMRILGGNITQRLAGRTINIHPSLLPAYPGLHTHERVLAAGDRMHGASIHFVTAALDGGPVISQVKIETREEDNPETLAARLLPLEHRLMVATVELFSAHSVKLRDDGIYVDNDLLVTPLALDDNGRLRGAALP